MRIDWRRLALAALCAGTVCSTLPVSANSTFPPSTPAGPTGALQYNNGGSFGGSSTLIQSSGKVGIGTTAPTNMLDVTGAVAIGTSYAYVGQAAPVNGLIVQGSVGIGTAAIENSASLDVHGSLNTSTSVITPAITGNPQTNTLALQAGTFTQALVGYVGNGTDYWQIGGSSSAPSTPISLDATGSDGTIPILIQSKGTASTIQFEINTNNEFIINNTGVAIGTTIPLGHLTLQNASSHAGQAACYTTGGQQGYCTGTVNSSGACSCTGL